MPYFPQDKSDKDVRIAMLAGKAFDGAIEGRYEAHILYF